jgi:hypothetical protein
MSVPYRAQAIVNNGQSLARSLVICLRNQVPDYNARVFSVLPYRFLLIFERFLTDGFPYVLFAFVKLGKISFRSKLV